MFLWVRSSSLEDRSIRRCIPLYPIGCGPQSDYVPSKALRDDRAAPDVNRNKDSSLAMALVLASCTWPLNFFLEGKFTMSVWAFAFPLDALAAAAVTVYSYTGYDTMQVEATRERRRRGRCVGVPGMRPAFCNFHCPLGRLLPLAAR